MSFLLNPYVFSDSRTFISIWDTRQVSTGSSDANSITLPISTVNMLNLTVDWGDGTVNNSNTHTYAEQGVKMIKIKGYIIMNPFNNSGDRLKLREITSWGEIYLSGAGIFRGVTNLSLANASGKPIIGNNLSSFLRDNNSVTRINGVNTWDTSNVTTFIDAFRASAFNDNIGNWNFSGVTLSTGFDNIMAQKTPANFSASNYDSLLLGLANQVNGLPSNVVWSAGTVKHTQIGADAKAILIAQKNWTFTDGGQV